MTKKVTLQINRQFGDNMISAYGTINEMPTLITANNFPNLLKKIKKSVKIENLCLTFQPER